MATLPQYQNLGCGSLLVQEAVNIADAHHIPIFCEANLASRDLFEQFGFEEKAEIRLNAGLLGGNGWRPYWAMLRLPENPIVQTP